MTRAASRARQALLASALRCSCGAAVAVRRRASPRRCAGRRLGRPAAPLRSRGRPPSRSAPRCSTPRPRCCSTAPPPSATSARPRTRSTGSLRAELRADAPAPSSRELERALRRLAQRRRRRGPGRARGGPGEALAALRRGAYAVTLEAASAGDVAAAPGLDPDSRLPRRRPASRAPASTRPPRSTPSRPARSAPTTRRSALRKDLLDAYQARLGDYLDEAGARPSAASARRSPSPRRWCAATG